MSKKQLDYSRRNFLSAVTGTTICLPTMLQAQERSLVPRNQSGFKVHKWEDHFEALGRGLILSDIDSRVLQHWTADGEMRLYPTSVPASEDLTKRGYTEVIEKRVAPGWAPTPEMRLRNPEWPEYIPGGDPLNPLGSHALYLSWQYYRIHGTQDTRKIGRKSSNGCIGLYNEQIAEVYERAPIGTKVLLL